MIVTGDPGWPVTKVDYKSNDCAREVTCCNAVGVSDRAGVDAMQCAVRRALLEGTGIGTQDSGVGQDS